MISAVLGQFLAGPYRGTGIYRDPTLVARTVAFTLSGGNLRTFIQLPMVCGVYALTGRNAALTSIWESGTFALFGRASGFSVGLPAGSNAFAFTGNSAVLLRSAIGNLDATVGSFGLTGRSAANAIGAPAGSGTFALTGRALGDALGFPAISGVFTFTGYATSYSVGLPASRGIFALTGNAAAINIGHGLLAGSGTFVLTGRAATIVHVGKLAAGAGSFALTGNAAAFTNPTIWNSADKASGVAISGLTASLASGGSDANVRATHTRGAGKYFEAVATALTISANNSGVGLANSSESLTSYLGSSTNSIGWFADGYVQGPGVAGHFAPGFDVGDVLGVELLSSSINVYKNGTLAFTFSTIPSGSLYPAVTLHNSGDSLTANFGASSLSYLPSGDTSWDG